MKSFDASEGSPTKKYVVIVGFNVLEDFLLGSVLLATRGVEVATAGVDVESGVGDVCDRELITTAATESPATASMATIGNRDFIASHHTTAI